jgi:hypothetical protein
MRRVLMAVAVMTWIAVSAEAQSLFSLEGANIRLESQAPKSAPRQGPSEKKSDSLKGFFKDFRAGSCRAQASPAVPSSSWPARGEAAVTMCKP